MPVSAHLPEYRWFHVLQNAAVGTGVYVGTGLSFIFIVWLLLANYVAFLERFASARNLVAAIFLGSLALVPVFRFFRQPVSLITSSVIAWCFFTIFYRALCLIFSGLSDWHSTFQVFMYGAVVYLIIATVCWIGSIIWRTRSSHISHSNHHHVS
jgi:hypothetical protein